MFAFCKSCTVLSNATGQATFIAMMLTFRPGLMVIVEQPSGSWAFKQPFMVSLRASFGLHLGSNVCMTLHDLASCCQFVVRCCFMSNHIWNILRSVEVHRPHIHGIILPRFAQVYALAEQCKVGGWLPSWVITIWYNLSFCFEYKRMVWICKDEDECGQCIPFCKHFCLAFFFQLFPLFWILGPCQDIVVDGKAP